MNNINIINFLNAITFFLVIKWFFVVGLIMYSIFAIVVVKQVSIMSESVESSVNPVIKLMSWLHLAMAALLVVAAIVML